MSIAPDAASLMQQASGEYQQSEQASADGLYGSRPELEGTYDAWVKEIHVEVRTAKGVKMNEAGATQDVQVLAISLEYDYHDPNDPNTTVSFRGKPYEILPNYLTRTTGKAQTRWKINLEKVAKNLSVLSSTSNKDATIQQQIDIIKAQVASGTIPVRVKVSRRPWSTPEIKDASGVVTKQARSGKDFEDLIESLNV